MQLLFSDTKTMGALVKVLLTWPQMYINIILFKQGIPCYNFYQCPWESCPVLCLDEWNFCCGNIQCDQSSGKRKHFLVRRNLKTSWRNVGCSLPYPHEQETPWGIHKYCEPPRKITLKRPFGQWRHLTTTTILPEIFRFLLSWAIWGFCY